MATKPLTSEAIALTEKKMDMTLGLLIIYLCSMLLNNFWFWHIIMDLLFIIVADDIIKMSKTTTTKDKKPRTSVTILHF